MGAEGGSREIPGYFGAKDDGKVEVRRSSITYVLGARTWSCGVKSCLRMGPDVSVASERHGTSLVKIW